MEFVKKKSNIQIFKKKIKNLQIEIESRIDHYQFERVCDELQRALNREKQVQDLFNEQNNQLKSLTGILRQKQKKILLKLNLIKLFKMKNIPKIKFNY